MAADINLRLPRVKAITGLSSSTIWRMEKEGRFPLRRLIGKRAVAWLDSEVQAWIKSHG